ncbi:MAG: type 1 glutamine amidotransferase domain-containing protein [Paracoccaceae bacterium]
MAKLDGKRIAILATHGFEFSELDTPRTKLKEMGAEVDVISPEGGEIRGWQGDDWGDSIPVDRTLQDAEAGDYDALVIPGGQINPDLLRVNDRAVGMVRAFFEQKKPLAAICHGPWLLIEADVVRGRQATSYKSIRTDMKNAGAEWTDAPVVCHQALITSRHPGDLGAFVDKIAEEVIEGRHEARRTA